MKHAKILSLIFLAALFSCTEEITSLTDGKASLNELKAGHSRMTLRLTDAPAVYDEVNIDIIGVEAIVNDSVVHMDVNAGIYNLLDFTNGKDTVLVDQQIPSGTLSQIRLILGPNNTLVKGTSIYPLTTPSAQQSGLKLNVHADFTQGFAYEYVIDFDASKSIVTTGNGKHILKPVLKVFTSVASGSIMGVVIPPAAKSRVYAISAALDSTMTLADTIKGTYMFRGLQSGVYKIAFKPIATYRDSVLSNISVTNGMVTKLDTMKLKLK